MVKSAIFLGFMAMLVWAHHMFLTGMGTTMSAFFQTTTMIVSIPSVIILSAFFVSLYGGSIRFTTPALFALANRIRALSIYWYFVDVVWICIFAVFYLL